ncbi:MAG: DUF58 domain-containing protein [Tepidisphaeraceae bacterium]
MSELFDPAFVAMLRTLRMVLRPAAAVALHGEHRAPLASVSPEFRDHRPYVVGDDVRHVDWNLYRRSGELFVRRFTHFQPVPCYVLLDASESMKHAQLDRMLLARRVAAAFAAAALHERNPVRIHAFGQTISREEHAGPPVKRLEDALTRLATVEARGVTSIATSLRELNGLARRPGVLVIVSDFYDPAGLAALDEALADVRHRLVLARVGHRDDGEPTDAGEIEFQDCESGQTRLVSVTPAVLERYRSAYATFEKNLADLAMRRRAVRVWFDLAEGVDGRVGIERAFPGGVIEV